MLLKRFNILQFISATVLFFFTWTFGGACDLAYAAKCGFNNPANQKQTPNISTPIISAQGQLAAALNRISRLEDKIQKKIQAGQDITSEETAIKNERSGIDKYDAEIMAQFKATGEKIKGLSAVIKQRQTDFVSKYQENIQILKSDLDAINQAATPAKKKQAHDALKAFLETTKPPMKHTPLDPNKLPNRPAKPVFKKPRTSPAEFKKDIQQQTAMRRKPVLVASAGPLTGLLDASSSNETMLLAEAAPTSADLAQTDEVQFTPAIVAQAQALGNNPVQIYNWVKNNIQYVPTYGSIQGADMCLQTRQCNDFDTASLLIALLRASNVPAHYVYGTIQMPIGNVENWVGGFTNAESALNLIASGGVPVTGMTSSGGTVSAAQMEHVWVEAYVPYGNYRGIMQDKSIQTWIPLDASYKQYQYTQGINILNATGLDPSTVYNQFSSDFTIDSNTGAIMNVDTVALQNQSSSYTLAIQNALDTFSNTPFINVIGGGEINGNSYNLLPSSLQYKVVSVLDRYSTIPDSLRYKVQVQMTDDYGDQIMGAYTSDLPALASKKITISYDPATSSDEDTLAQYANGTATSLPAYLINLVPVLKIEGTEMESGTSVGMGTSVNVNISFIDPSGNIDNVVHSRTAGDFSALVLNYGAIGGDLLNQRKAKLQATETLLQNGQTSQITKDDLLGELLNVSMLGYWAKTQIFNQLTAQSLDVAAVQQPSEGLNSLALDTTYLFDAPDQVVNAGMSIDIQRDLVSTAPKDDNTANSYNYMVRTGIYSSYMESGIYDQVFQQPGAGISAVSAISIAEQQGIPIYTINQSNINSILPLLNIDPSAEEDIINAANAGKKVIVPGQDISLNGWSGAGYIILDPNTGAGAFMISGGQAGGWSPMKWLGLAGLVIAIILLAIAGVDEVAILIDLLIDAVEWLFEFLTAEVIPTIIEALEFLADAAEAVSEEYTPMVCVLYLALKHQLADELTELLSPSEIKVWDEIKPDLLIYLTAEIAECAEK